MNRLIVLALFATLVTGCSESWRTTTYDARRSCESFGGRYQERTGTCPTGGDVEKDLPR